MKGLGPTSYSPTECWTELQDLEWLCLQHTASTSAGRYHWHHHLSSHLSYCKVGSLGKYFCPKRLWMWSANRCIRQHNFLEGLVCRRHCVQSAVETIKTDFKRRFERFLKLHIFSHKLPQCEWSKDEQWGWTGSGSHRNSGEHPSIHSLVRL